MIKLYVLVVSILCFTTSFSQVTISGSTGINATYTSLTNAGGAFAAINSAASQTGNYISVTITADLSGETGANSLGFKNWTKLSIIPSGTRTVSGTVNGNGMIVLFNAQKVTIDGLNTGGNSLTFTNSSTSSSFGSSTILFAGSTIDCKIANCTILGASTGTAGNVSPGTGTVYFNASGTGCDRDTVINNNIGNAAAGLPSMAVSSLGNGVAVANEDCVIRANNIYNWYSTANSAAINLGSHNYGWTIDQNRCYQTASRTGLASFFYFRFIYINSTGGGFTISNNILGYANSSGTGMLTNTGGRLAAIDMTVGSSPVSSVQGNTINNINWASDDLANGLGTNNTVCLFNLQGAANIGTITGNTFGETGTIASATNGIYLSTTATAGGFGINPININGTAACTVQNNNIGSIGATGLANSPFVFNGIVIGGNFSHTVTGNMIGGTVSNSISIGQAGVSTTATQVAALYNYAGGSANTITLGAVGNGNTIRNITANGSSAYAFFGIYNTTSPGTLNINGNTFEGNTMAGIGNYYLIYNQGSPVNALNMNNNSVVSATISATSNSSPSGFFVNAGAGAAACAVSISNNSFAGSPYTGSTGGTGAFYCILNQATSASATIDNNNFNNLSLKSGGIVYLCYNGCLSNTVSFSNNFITTGFAKTVSGGNFYGYFNSRTAPGGTATINNNDLSNIAVTGATSFTGILNDAGSAQVCNITNNTIGTITGGTSTMWGMYVNSGAAGSTISGNTISGFTAGSATVYGIIWGLTSAPVSLSCFDNNINGFSSSGSGGTMYGMYSGSGTTVNVYRNKIYNLQANHSAASVHGLAVWGTLVGSNTTIYNNFISDLRAPSANSTNPTVTGIGLYGTGTPSAVNVYYNSIYLDAVSSGTNFSTAGLFHTSNATATTAALSLIDNIIVNTSTAKGPGVTAAYRRSNTTLTNFASTSDYNLFYAGTPSASRLIFYDGTNSDQTLSAYQTRVSTRDANSISLMPGFVSATDLHLTTANCRIEGRGTPVAGITDDIDLAVRNVTTPDIGADEFTATTSTTLAGVMGSAVCEDRTVSVTGTTYTSNACDLIAWVLPSGGDPVAGKVNVCVTLDATQQYFNGEPYVQRHFDLEPTTSNQTTTSATITLYFNNAEFILYNTTNPVWPQLPTYAGDPNIANVKVTQFHGTPTGGLPTSTPGNYTGVRVLLAPVSVVLTGSIWAVTVNVAGFSGFYVHTNFFNAPLPVTINYFNGTKQGSDHLLNWKVSCNSTPSVTMVLERSADSRNFNAINSITADAARCNQPFNYTDANPLPGMNYYRLKIEDAAGKISYSGIVALLNAVKGFDIISIAPNPVVTDNFTLNVTSAQASKMDLVIIDMQGRIVNRQSIALTAGFSSIPIQIGNLSAASYLIQGMIGEERSRVIRFVKQNL